MLSHLDIISKHRYGKGLSKRIFLSEYHAINNINVEGKATVLTVWKKSLLFNCNGFQVYDGKGGLVFRVDNYMNGNKNKIVLMDSAGKPILTIRRKMLSLGDCWTVYDGEAGRTPRLKVRKQVNILNNKSLAYVSSKKTTLYEIEGSYLQRCCRVYDEKNRKVAEIESKEGAGGVGLGADVFRLIVQPYLETSIAMALVVVLDQM